MDLIEGIVVKTIPYQENTKIVFVITEFGKQSILVKGATNAKSRTFQYAHELIKIAFSTKGKYFSSGKRLEGYDGIKKDPQKILSALRIIEIAYDLIEHINDAPVFYHFLDEILFYLNQSNKPLLFETMFRVKTLYLLGLAPVFTKCVQCGTHEHLMGFSFYNGGMICTKCLRPQDVVFSESIMATLKWLYVKKLNELVPIIDTIDLLYQPTDTFLNLYYEHYLGYKSKVARISPKL